MTAEGVVYVLAETDYDRFEIVAVFAELVAAQAHVKGQFAADVKIQWSEWPNDGKPGRHWVTEIRPDNDPYHDKSFQIEEHVVSRRAEEPKA